MSPLSHSFEDLAQSLRILLEANFSAERGGLLRVDRAEAAGNVESALTGVLNAFHSLYDAMSKAGLQSEPAWYATPELATMLVLRNARHHNHAHKIRTVYNYYAHETEKLGEFEHYVFVDFPVEDNGGDTFDVYLSWNDLESLLLMPAKEAAVKAETADAVRKYLRADRFGEYASAARLSPSRVMFNVVPLIANAGCKVARHLTGKIDIRSTEAESFLRLFNVLGQADTEKPEVYIRAVAWN
ncbi:hypothetical protein [Paraburkholderia dilworthii]|uniref:hypothetical protein n=1 Tax=Paraburkholderia dilworthii TaxID=948106 RepID=UPI00055B084D|nr:hypothetical protein [Paraburkholderia dilworthii]